MRPGVGQQHRVPMRQQKLRVTGHPQPVIPQSMKNQRSVPVARCRSQQPTPQDHLIRRSNRNILQLSSHRGNRALESGGIFLSQWTACRTKSPIRQVNTADHAQSEVEEEEQEKPTQSAAAAHSRKFYEAQLKEVPIEIEIGDTGEGPTAVH